MERGNHPRKPQARRGRLFKTKSCALPRLTDLRKELGYGHAGQAQDIAFKRALKAQVESFVSPSDNIPGFKFTQWKTPEHQRGLLEMTKDFLDTKGKGIEFWPDDPLSPNKRPLEYSKNSSQIHSLVAKVFYRTAREHKRKPSTNSIIYEQAEGPKNIDIHQSSSQSKPEDCLPHNQTKPKDSRGRSVDDPIDLENMQSTTNPSGPSADNDSLAASGMSFDLGRFEPLGDMPDGLPVTRGPFEGMAELLGDVPNPQVPETTNGASSGTTRNTSGVDLYDVPNSPTEATTRTQDKGKRPAEPNLDEANPRAKFPRQEHDNSAEGVNNPTGTAVPGAAASGSASVPRKRKPRQVMEKTRFSDRAKKTTRRPDFAREKTVEAFIFTSSSSRVSSDSEQEDPVRPSKEPPGPERVPNGPQNVSSETAQRQPKPRNAPKAKTTKRTLSRPGQQTTAAQAGPSTGSGPEHQGSGSGASNTEIPGETARSDTNSGQPHHQHTERPVRQLVFNERERMAIAVSKIRYFSSVDGFGARFETWTPSGSRTIFHFSLQALAIDLHLRPNFQSLTLILETREKDIVEKVDQNDEDSFNDIKENFLHKITREYQRALDASEDVSGLKFRIYLQQQQH
ncbi:hypothetical protein FZEAL_3268 [Fusarium zealandicum]|uniref:Uncharacterized protein n=1 Tax=Fusarium zealandicum TaxID=1053134 RepID=A0A8H4XLZ1_9HYPO|nr:hypothetical protein FZEAL_3268 [Fusarium zealandicum]